MQPETHSESLGLGIASMVLGYLALLLFFLPILGIPISVCGALFGLAGVLISSLSPHASLRWSLAGLALSLFALLINLALYNAPAGLSPDRPPRPTPGPLGHYVAPPA
jgi:hypothetical protein